MSDTPEHMATVSTPAAALPRASNMKIDVTAGTVTRDGTVYSIDSLPAQVQRTLALHGLRYKLTTGATLDDLRAGQVRKVRASPWHEAVALAIVEKTKKLPVPQTIEQARVTARQHTDAQHKSAKTDPVVVKHYLKLNANGVSGLDTLLNGSEVGVA